MRRPSARTLSLLALLTITAACNGGSGGLSHREGTVEVLLRNTPIRDLSAFSGVLESLILTSDTGPITPNLLLGPMEIEFLGLQDRSALITNALVERGTYDRAELTFQASSLRATSKDGVEIPVVSLNDTVEFVLQSPPQVTSQGYSRVQLELDLRSSVLDPLSPATLGFAPTGTGYGSNGPGLEPLDDLKGIVLASDPLTSSFRVQAFLDDDLTTPLREMDVVLDAAAYLEDEADLAFPDEASFFAALVDNQTLVELHGSQDGNGVCFVERVEIEDQVGGMDADDQVKIEGWIVGVDTMGTLQLVIQEVEQGGGIASGVLGNLGNPQVLDVTFDTTLPVFEDLNTPQTTAALEVGQRVKVKFEDFVGTPFPARSVEIVAPATFEAEIELVQLASLEVRFHANDFAIQGGLVQDASTLVDVDLGNAKMLLDLNDRPALSGIDLLPGQQVTIEGTLSGPPSAPVVQAKVVRVVPGRFQGEVLSDDQPGSSFEALVGELPQSFGSTFPVSRISIHPDCVFRGDAATETEFHALFATAAPDAVLDVDVQGLASGPQNEVAAYVIEVVSH